MKRDKRDMRLCETCGEATVPFWTSRASCKRCQTSLPDSHLTPRERNVRDKIAVDYYREFSSCSGGDRV